MNGYAGLGRKQAELPMTILPALLTAVYYTKV
jgi:hypothetical protein